MSTINPNANQKKLPKQFESTWDITMLDTPVMGGPNVAINGELVSDGGRR